jgi:hypothetical protein
MATTHLEAFVQRFHLFAQAMTPPQAYALIANLGTSTLGENAWTKIVIKFQEIPVQNVSQILLLIL